MPPRERNVCLQVFSYDEPDLTPTLDAYAEQPVPAWAHMSYQACVTPAVHTAAPGGGHRAGMVQQAEDHPVFELVDTPPGKLSSRNAGHRTALNDGADIIVAADVDAPPLDDHTLIHLLEPFEDPDVVASNGFPVAPLTPVGTMTNIGAWATDFVAPHLNGQLHAITARAWDEAGPFETAHETDGLKTRIEEEFRFRRRVGRLGRIAEAPAKVFNDTRRTECQIGLRNDEYCDRIGGDVTFSPR